MGKDDTQIPRGAAIEASIIVTVSRPHFTDVVIDNLRRLDLRGERCQLVVMVDNNQMDDFITEDVKAKFSDVVFKHSTHSTKPMEGNIPNARNRIAQLRNESKEVVADTKYVFSFEDDTIIPSDSFYKLRKSFYLANEANPTGLVSGVQVARHGLKVLGAWHVDNAQFPTEITSLGKNEVATTLAEVSGTGFYCYLTPTKLYKEATYGWHEPVGPDVYYGLWLRTKGLSVYVDQSVVCGHKVGTERAGYKVLMPDNVDVIQARFTKHGETWKHEIIGQK